DPLLAKLVSWAETRTGTMDRLKRALSEYTLTGVRTNIAFFREVLSDPDFRKGCLSTAFLDGFFARRRTQLPIDMETEAAAAVAQASACEPQPTPTSFSRWLIDGREDALR